MCDVVKTTFASYALLHFFTMHVNVLNFWGQVIRVLPYYTKLAMLSTLYCFVVKGKFITKSFPPVGLEHQHLKILIPMPIHMS